MIFNNSWIDEDQDLGKFTMYDNDSNEIGHIMYEKIIEISYLFSEQEYIDIDNDFGIDNLFPAEKCYYLKYVEIDTKYQGQGYGSILLREFLMQRDNDPNMFSEIIVLNASPYLTSNMLYKLPINILTTFYERFNFKIILNQKTNNIMYRNMYDI